MAKVIEHKDKLGRSLVVGDCVAYPDGNNLLKIGLVDKLNPKMIRVKGFKQGYTSNKYPSETVKLDSSDITMYILKNR
jgi:hypothetical protein